MPKASAPAQRCSAPRRYYLRCGILPCPTSLLQLSGARSAHPNALRLFSKALPFARCAVAPSAHPS
eukprot:15464829-Alexandrium_andersonii.AAC.1